jgi:hypothetical protein
MRSGVDTCRYHRPHRGRCAFGREVPLDRGALPRESGGRRRRVDKSQIDQGHGFTRSSNHTANTCKESSRGRTCIGAARCRC